MSWLDDSNGIPHAAPHIIGRDGSLRLFDADEIKNRIIEAVKIAKVDIDITELVSNTVQACRGVDRISTQQIDDRLSEFANNRMGANPDYGRVAAYIAVTALQRNTNPKFSGAVRAMANHVAKDGRKAPLVNDRFLADVEANADELDAMIDNTKDYRVSYQAIMLLRQSYLRRAGKVFFERVQYFYMRIAVALWGRDMKRVRKVYNGLATHLYTQATPTLCNAGSIFESLASCFLIMMKGDSLEGIYDTLKTCALISKYAGGIGLNVHDIRAKGAYIKGTDGTSNGLVPMLRVFDASSQYVDQCFVPDTLVWTQRGAIKIKDVRQSDKVIAEDGCLHNVLGIKRFNNEIEPSENEMEAEKILKTNLRCITTRHGLETIVTGGHPMLAVKGNKFSFTGKDLSQHIARGFSTPEFVPVDELEVGDFLVRDRLSLNPKDYVDIQGWDEDDCRFLAVLSCYGYFDPLRRHVKFEPWGWDVQGYMTRKQIKFTKNVVDGAFGDEIDRITVKIDQPDFPFNEEQFATGLDPAVIYLPQRKFLAFISMIHQQLYKRSTKIIPTLRMIQLRAGFDTFLNDANEFEAGVTFRPFEYPGKREYVTIQKIEPVFYEYPVLYDLEIADVHSYMTEAGIAHNGGNKRPGSIAIYCEPWHADFTDFLKASNPFEKEEFRAHKLFYAVWANDLFFERYEADKDWSFFCPLDAPGLSEVYGEKFKELYERYEREGRARTTMSAVKLLSLINSYAPKTGQPYICAKDAFNEKSNQKHLGTMKGSNLCVSGETYLLTDKGQIQIGDLEGQSVRVWNGSEWSETKIMCTNPDSELVKVTTNDGGVLECTQYHKFILKDGSRVDAQMLKPGLELTKWKQIPEPVNDGQDFQYAYTHGLFCADGTYNSDGTPRISLHRPKHCLLPLVECLRSSKEVTADGVINCQLPRDIARKMVVPVDASVKSKIEWLSGYFDGDGCADTRNRCTAIEACSIDLEFLSKIRLMLQTLGVKSNITLSRKAGTMHFSTKWGEYDCPAKALYSLAIGGDGVYRLWTLGLRTKRMKLLRDDQTDVLPSHHSALRYVKVVSVEHHGRRSKTFCLNEPLRHAAVFNGILTGQCGEIGEFTSENEVAVCNLASISLPAFVQEDAEGFTAYDLVGLSEAAYDAAMNCNRVIDLTFYPTPEAEHSNKKHRPIGIGYQGLDDVFAMMRYPWTSKAAETLNTQIAEAVAYGAHRANIDLAIENGTTYASYEGSPLSKGIWPWMMWGVKPSNNFDFEKLEADRAKHGAYLSLCIAPMPTMSTSVLLDNTECFEPRTSNIFMRRGVSGEFPMYNKHLIKDLKKEGLWTQEIRDLILANDGSVQGIKQIPARIQRLHLTAYEVDPKIVIRFAALRGPFVCQSQSLNWFVSNPTVEYLNELTIYAWKLGLKTLRYYLRIKQLATSHKIGIDSDVRESVKKRKKSDGKGSRISRRRTDSGSVVFSDGDSNSIIGTSPPTATGAVAMEVSMSIADETAQTITEEGAVCTLQPGCFSCGS